MKLNILVPDDLNDITLQQYQKFENLNTSENQNTAFLLHKMIEIFCNINLTDIAKIKYNDVQKIAKHINKLFEVKPALQNTFTLNNIKYGFIPQLDDMTLGEYIDLDNYLGDWKTMHKAMSVLYRPIKHQKQTRYNIEEYKGSNDKLLSIPLGVVMGSLVFFYSLNNELLKTTLNYLQKEIPNNLTLQQLETLEQSGGSINQSMELLKGMLPNLMK